jgi:hypothetical protein
VPEYFMIRPFAPYPPLKSLHDKGHILLGFPVVIGKFLALGNDALLSKQL